MRVDALSALVAGFRRAAGYRAAREGLAVGVVVAAAVVLALALAADHIPALPLLRLPLRVALLLALFAPPVTASLASRRRFKRDVDVARHLERGDSTLRSDLSSALELRTQPLPAEPVAALLRASLLARVDARAATLEGRVGALAPRRSLRGVARAGAAVIAALAVIAVADPEALRAVSSIVAGPPTAEDAPVAAVAIIGALDVRIAPPSYTALSPTRRYGVVGRIEALRGSEIELGGTLLRPVRDSKLVVQAPGRPVLELALDIEAGYASARLTASEDATWELLFDLGDGRGWVRDPAPRGVRVLDDRAPDVQLTLPAEEVIEVTPDQVVDLQYTAADDFGLATTAVVWEFFDDAGSARSQPLQQSIGRTSFEEHVPFDLLPLHLQPRDELRVYIEATDADAVSGSKRGVSRAVTLRVASAEDRSDAVLAAKQALFERVLAELGATFGAGLLAVDGDRPDGTLVVATAAPEVLPASVRAVRELSQRWPELIGAFQQVIAVMESDPQTVVADLERLRAVAGRFEATARAARGELDKLTDERLAAGVTIERLAPVGARVAELAEHLERAALLLEDQIASLQADSVSRAMEELSAARERLRELLEQYRDERDPATRDAIEREIRRLQQRMDELLARLRDQLDDLPLEHLNADAIEPDALSENIGSARTQMDAIRDAVAAGDIDAALAMLDQLDANVSAMQSELDPLASAQPQGASEFDEQMAALMESLNDLEAQQREVSDQTQALLDQLTAERAAELREQVESRMRAASERIASAAAALAAAPRDTFSDDVTAPLDAASDSLRRLQSQLDARDAVSAEASATRLWSDLNDLDWQLQREQALRRGEPAARQQATEARGATNDASDAVEEVRAAMRELIDASAPTPTAAQREQARGLGEGQGAAADRLDRLREQAQEMGRRFPEVPDPLEGPLGQVGSAMRGASGSLNQGEPRPALQQQQQALDGLRQLREQMQQLTQQQRQRDQRGGAAPEQHVEVPRDGESDRAELRRRVIESMREGALDDYTGPLREYYEQLLR